MLKDSANFLKSHMFPYFEKYDFCISAAGVRYGSVIYVGVGERICNPREITEYPVELEIDADDWEILRGEECLMDSNFPDIHAARVDVQKLLVGRRILDISATEDESVLVFDDRLILRSVITPDPASGFLYLFYVGDGPCWETVDGVSIHG